MRFVAALLLTVAVATVAAANGGARTQAPTATLAFISMSEDKVGTIQKNTKPDGIPDAHFTFVLDAPGETIAKMGLRSTQLDGTPAFGQRWDTIPGGDWIMGVFRNGILLNPLDSGVTDALDGPATYELYIQSVGEDGKPLVRTGNHYRVDVTFASGGGIAVGTTVGTPGSRLLTPIPIASPPGTPAPPAVAPPTTPPPATPAPPAAKPAVALTASATRARAKGCVVLKPKATAAPAGAKLVLERKAGSAWVAVASATVCSTKAGAVTYRATLKAGTAVVARSNALTITWQP